MGKLIEDESILEEKNINAILDSKSKCAKKICEISKEDLDEKDKSPKKVIDALDIYYKKTRKKAPYDKQLGRVWILLHRNAQEEDRVLQVAQALDRSKDKGFFNELYSHVEEIFSAEKKGQYAEYARDLSSKEKLIFYEINVDKYLKKFAPKNYKGIIYSIAKDYFVEALLAYKTQAKDWHYLNCGMDKRSLYRLLYELENH